MSKKSVFGRPPGAYDGHYKPPHIVKQHVPLRLPGWLKQRLKNRNINVSLYIEKLILADTGWNEPKK